jgi:hypothetical protein
MSRLALMDSINPTPTTFVKSPRPMWDRRTELSHHFEPHNVRPAGFEPAAHGLEVHCSVQTELRALVCNCLARWTFVANQGLEVRCSIQLSYGRRISIVAGQPAFL